MTDRTAEVAAYICRRSCANRGGRPYASRRVQKGKCQ
jgi:hypothetical protein